MGRHRPRHSKTVNTPQVHPRDDFKIDPKANGLADMMSGPTEDVIKGLVKDIQRRGIPEKSISQYATPGTKNVENRELNIRTTPICWGIPLDEVMYAKFFENFFRLGYMPWDSISCTESTYLPGARNDIHEFFVTKVNIPYLMMLDSDVLAPPDIVMKLMRHKLPIVGGWYRNKKEKWPVVYDFGKVDEVTGWHWYNQRQEAGTGLEKVDGAGAGCWLMSREVAVAIGERPYNMETGGEDLTLCGKIKEAGFDIYIDWDVSCAHAGVWYV